MKRLGPSYLWLMSLAVPAAGLFPTGCSSTPPTSPGATGGSSNTGSGGSGLSSGTGTGGGTSFATGGTAIATGGAPSASGGTTATPSGGSGITSGGTTATPSGGTGITTGGSVATSGGGSLGTTGGAPTAGTSTTGGAGGLPAGGSGGAGPRTKLCASSAPAAPVFVDFETYDGKAAAGAWAFSPVMSSFAGFWPGGTPPVTLSVLGGHAGNYGFNVNATGATGTWSGIGTWMSGITCLDASAFTGITLWVRGLTPTGLFSLSVNLEETTPPDPMDPAGGGTCTGTCMSPTANDLPVTADWTQINIPWAMFMGGTNGAAPVALTGARIVGFTISFGFAYGPNPSYVATDPASPEYIPLPGNIDFNFDDLGFSI